jgi:hypothetical protein
MEEDDWMCMEIESVLFDETERYRKFKMDKMLRGR